MRGRKLHIAWQDDADQLYQFYRREQDAELKPRLHALWLLRGNHSARQTAHLVGVHYATLMQWLAWYRSGGVAEVRRHKHGGRQGRAALLTAAQLAQLTDHAAWAEFRTGADVQQWLAETFGVYYKGRSIYSLLRRLGWKPKRTRPQAVNAIPAVQEEWKKGA
jgi:transposase